MFICASAFRGRALCPTCLEQTVIARVVSTTRNLAFPLITCRAAILAAGSAGILSGSSPLAARWLPHAKRTQLPERIRFDCLRVQLFGVGISHQDDLPMGVTALAQLLRLTRFAQRQHLLDNDFHLAAHD